MYEVDVICSGRDCEVEFQVWVEDLDEVDAAVCDSCGHSVVTLRVAAYEPELPVRIVRAATRSRRREPAAVH
jgi:hypothetical protein